MNDPHKLPDYYQILQVCRFADDFVIKAAYRALASRFHPDKNQHGSVGNSDMQVINVAYETLGDPEKKAAYDQLLQQKSKLSDSDSNQMTGAVSAGRIIGKRIVKELLRKSR